MELLKESDYNFLKKQLSKKQFSKKTDEELKLLEKKITILFKKTKNLTSNFLKNGFIDNYSDINYKEFFNFIMKLIPFIEKFKDLKGEKKLEFLLIYTIFLIIKILPISNDVKQHIIDIIIDIIPDIVESVILISKTLHTGLKYIFKKIFKGLKRYCCKRGKTN